MEMLKNGAEKGGKTEEKYKTGGMIQKYWK